MAQYRQITKMQDYYKICNLVTDWCLGSNVTGGLSEIALDLTVAKV